MDGSRPSPVNVNTSLNNPDAGGNFRVEGNLFSVVRTMGGCRIPEVRGREVLPCS